MLGKIKDGKCIPIEITHDHHPDLKAERERIEKCGGEIKKADSKSPYRVFWKNSMIPGLAMTRAIGDVVCQSLGVIAEPEINVFNISDDDEFILLCSDGVWEFLSNAAVIGLVSSNMETSLECRIEGVCRKSYNLWIENEKEVSDDITCVMLNLNKKCY